jgi:hypothetical protein
MIDILPVQLLMPLEFMVDCHAEQLDSFGRQTLIREFAFLHGVLVRIGENQVANSPAPTCQVTLRGSRQEMNRLKEAVHHLQRINGSVSPVPQVVIGPLFVCSSATFTGFGSSGHEDGNVGTIPCFRPS